MSRAIRYTSATHSPNKRKKYSIVIPSAGQGRRMLTYGNVSLIKVNNKRIIDRQIEAVGKTFNQYEIILVTGFQHEKVHRYIPSNIVSVHNADFMDTNVLYSIGLGIKAATTNNIVVLYGDLVFNAYTLKCPFDNDDLIVICDHMQDREVGTVITNGFAQNMCYSLPNKWAHIMYLTGETVEIFKRISQTPGNSKMFGFEALNILIEMGVPIKTIKPKRAKVVDVDISKDIRIAEQI